MTADRVFIKYICPMKKAFLQLHAAVFLAGFTAILGKLIELNEGLLVWYRMWMTALMLGVWLLIRGQLKRLPFRDVAKTAGVGLVIAFHWVAFYASVKYSTVSVALVCFSATGFFTAVFEPILLRKRIVWQELLLGIIAISGIYVIFDFHPQYKVGIAFGIIAAMGSALFPVMNKQLLLRLEPRTLTIYEMAGGWVLFNLLLPVYLHFFPAQYYIPTGSDWGWLVILSALCTVVCFDLQLNALKKISAFTANLTYNLEPVYGIILAFIFFQEGKMLNQWFYLGLGLIMLAIVLQMIRVSRNKK